MTYSEVRLWDELKNGQMMEYDFDRQKPIYKYIVDFYCKDVSLVIEIDGITHDDLEASNYDERRQKELELLGITFLRFNALDVVHDMVNIIQQIENWLLNYEDKHGPPETVKNKGNKLSLTTPTAPSSSYP